MQPTAIAEFEQVLLSNSIAIEDEGALAGLAAADAATSEPEAQTLAIDEVMASPPQVPVLAPDDALWDAVELMNESGLDGLVVADAGQLAGLVTRDGLADAIRTRAAARAAGSG